MRVDLSNNENILGASPQAVEAAREALSRIHKYPPRQGAEIVGRLASVHGVQSDQVILGNGAQHVLRVIAATFLGPGRVAVGLDPTYTGYQAATTVARSTFIGVPASNGGYDRAAWVDAVREVDLVWFCSPNNPTGCAATMADARAVLAAAPRTATFVFDATYSDFLDDPEAADADTLLREDSRVVIVKTFSKLYGLAGLRVGYAVASRDRVAELQERIDTFPVNQIALAAGSAAIDDTEHQQKTRDLVLSGRAQLTAGFAALGLEAYVSQANFVTVRVGDLRDAIIERAADSGYLIRSLAGLWRLPQHVRVTVGEPKHNEGVLEAFRDVFQGTSTRP